MFIFNAISSFIYPDSPVEQGQDHDDPESTSLRPTRWPMARIRIAFPSFLNSDGTFRSNDASKSIHSNKLIELIFLEYLNQNRSNPRSFLLTSRQWYAVAMTH